MFSNDFSDAITTGTITNRGDQTVAVTDAAAPIKGVLIATDRTGGAAPAIFSVCGGSATFSLGANIRLLITCGSVTLDVVSGTVEVTFVADDGTLATTSLDEGNGLTFDSETITFTAPPTNTKAAVVVIEEQEISISLEGGNSVEFDSETVTFSAPPTNTAPVEVVVGGEEISVGAGETAQPEATPTPVPSPTPTPEDGGAQGPSSA